MSLLQKQLLSKRLPPKLPGQRTVTHQRDFTPLSWELYFDEKRNVDVDGSTFCVYLSGFNDQENKLTLVLLHGGGYSALTWTVILLQAQGGLLVAVVVKYADNILKGFATSFAIVLSCVISVYLFDFQVTMQFVVGTAFVIISIFLYSKPSTSSSATKLSESLRKT